MTEKVGYGSPPRHTRFRKGQSGNPRGRPKRAASLGDDLTAELSEVIHLTEGGKRKRITKQRAVIKALTAGAIKGDSRAAALLMKWLAWALDTGIEGQAAPSLSAEDQKILEEYLKREVERRRAASPREGRHG